MSKLKELIAQKEALTKEIEELRKQEHAEGISKAKALIAEHQLTQKDLFGGTAKSKKTKTASTAIPKYRDPTTGNEWTGQGRTPNWMKDSGKDKEAFLIGRQS